MWCKSSGISKNNSKAEGKKIEKGRKLLIVGYFFIECSHVISGHLYQISMFLVIRYFTVKKQNSFSSEEHIFCSWRPRKQVILSFYCRNNLSCLIIKTISRKNRVQRDSDSCLHLYLITNIFHVFSVNL